MQTAQLSKSVSVSWSPFLMVRTCNLLMAFFAASPRRRCGTNRDSQTEAHLGSEKPMPELRIESIYCLTWCISSINVRQSVIICVKRSFVGFQHQLFIFFFWMEVTKRVEMTDKLTMIVTSCTRAWGICIPLLYGLGLGIRKRLCIWKNLILGFKKTSVENHLLENKEQTAYTVGQLKVLLLLNNFLQIRILNCGCWFLSVATDQIL